MNHTIQIALHVLALTTLLSPLWFEMTAPPREPYTHDPKAYRKGRISYLLAVPLFVVCLTLDILNLSDLSDKAGLWIAVWLALEIYWIIAFGTHFMKAPKDIRQRKEEGPTNT